MFGFGKPKLAPELIASNPGMGIEAKVAFSNDERSWTENVHMVKSLATSFARHSHRVKSQKSWLEHSASGFAVSPQLVALEPLDNGGVRTVTTIQVNHPKLCPTGVFEFQHSVGHSLEEAVTRGFDQWVETDFVALCDAGRDKPTQTTNMVMEFPAEGNRPVRKRRAVFGPVMHYMANPLQTCGSAGNEDHAFCPCCLFTNNFEAFQEMIEGDGFFGLRLYAARNEDGTPQADCRINGSDFEPGAEALRNYTQTWPAAGLEFRKQYVILQTIRNA